jgi:hypothetical protein
VIAVGEKIPLKIKTRSQEHPSSDAEPMPPPISYQLWHVKFTMSALLAANRTAWGVAPTAVAIALPTVVI